MGEVCCFISYAHDDDRPTGADPGEEGFVSFLQRMLEAKLRGDGSQVKLWRDARRFSGGDLFNNEIENALKTSAVLVVIMSNNWLSRPYCQLELEKFANYRLGERIVNVKERIVLVGKQYVPPESRPAHLQGQAGFLFYDYDTNDSVRGEKPFFDLGKAVDDRFFEIRTDLAQHLERRAKVIAAGGGTGTTLAAGAAIVPPNGRIVYLAKPATDMEQPYCRLVLELQARGFTVEPDITQDVPHAGAREYIQQALQKSEMSIHLVGEKPGIAPDDEDVPRLVKLQLSEARKRGAGAQDGDGAKFRRVVWAPRVLEAASAEADPGPVRDPIDTLTRFDEQSPSDMIEGDVLSRFIDLLRQYLTESAPRRTTSIVPGDGVEIFLNFNTRDDEEYGLAVATALGDAPISIIVRADGEPAPEALGFNREKLAKCKGVLLCWGAASEVWVRAEADLLNNWQALGREQQFAPYRLLVGPPAGPRKKAVNVLFRKNQFDKIIDLTDKVVTGDILIDVGPASQVTQP
jgi:TIR domain